MESTDGRRGGGACCSREAEATSSSGGGSGSSSGTVVSTAYTSSSSGASSSGPGKRTLDEMLETLECECDSVVGSPIEMLKEKYQRIKGLVREFFDGINPGVLERWFTELDVGWVLKHGASKQVLCDSDSAWRWIRALKEIMNSISCAYLYQSDGSCTSEPAPESLEKDINLVQLARFTEAAILKMLPFVDAVLAPPTSLATISAEAVLSNRTPPPIKKLQMFMHVLAALSNAVSTKIWLQSEESCCAQAIKSKNSEVLSLLSEKEGNLTDAIRDTEYEIRTLITALMDDDDSWGTTTTPLESPHIHKVTRSVISYTRLLQRNHSELDRIKLHPIAVCKSAPAISYLSLSNYLCTQTVSYLEEKLAKRSQSLPDQSLGFIFLINNLFFVQQELSSMYHRKLRMLRRKIKDCIQNYLQVSWAPVLSRLHSPTTLCLGYYSPLHKFESEFHKTYSTQKLWKVPHPEMRRRLRKAIIDKVIPCFTEYLLQDNATSTQGITLTPQMLEEMLQELFEG